MAELKVFTGIHQAIAHLCLRDGRPRKEIAQAAQLNASMVSGYCSGRLVPSLEHLDRLLTALGLTVEDLAAELRLVKHRRPQPPFNLPDHKDSDAAARMLRMLFKDLYDVMQAEQAAGGAAPPEPEPPPRSPADAAPRSKGTRRRGAKPRG